MTQEAPNQVFGIVDPDYARVYTQARVIAWQHGYACLAHGSFTRDLDLLFVPWTEKPTRDPDVMMQYVLHATGLILQSGSHSIRPHGRHVWSLLFPEPNDPRWVDFSVLALPHLETKTIIAHPGNVIDD